MAGESARRRRTSSARPLKKPIAAAKLETEPLRATWMRRVSNSPRSSDVRRRGPGRPQILPGPFAWKTCGLSTATQAVLRTPRLRSSGQDHAIDPPGRRIADESPARRSSPRQGRRPLPPASGTLPHGPSYQRNARTGGDVSPANWQVGLSAVRRLGKVVAPVEERGDRFPAPGVVDRAGNCAKDGGPPP